MPCLKSGNVPNDEGFSARQGNLTRQSLVDCRENERGMVGKDPPFWHVDIFQTWPRSKKRAGPLSLKSPVHLRGKGTEILFPIPTLRIKGGAVSCPLRQTLPRYSSTYTIASKGPFVNSKMYVKMGSLPVKTGFIPPVWTAALRRKFWLTT